MLKCINVTSGCKKHVVCQTDHYEVFSQANSHGSMLPAKEVSESRFAQTVTALTRLCFAGSHG